MPNEEQVLVIPTRVLHEAGLFQGLCGEVERYQSSLLDPRNFQFVPRSRAEDDPGFKQLIPYVVLKHGAQVFHYTRGMGAGEKRLRALRSIGVGGHINPTDQLLPSHVGQAFQPDSQARRPDLQGGARGEGTHPYRQGMLREVSEEVILGTTYRESCLGFINDDSTPVGQVHLGIVHVFELAEPKVERREADVTKAGFAPIGDLLREKAAFETWSQFVLEELSAREAQG